MLDEFRGVLPLRSQEIVEYIIFFLENMDIETHKVRFRELADTNTDIDPMDIYIILIDTVISTLKDLGVYIDEDIDIYHIPIYVYADMLAHTINIDNISKLTAERLLNVSDMVDDNEEIYSYYLSFYTTTQPYTYYQYIREVDDNLIVKLLDVCEAKMEEDDDMEYDTFSRLDVAHRILMIVNDIKSKYNYTPIIIQKVKPFTTEYLLKDLFHFVKLPELVISKYLYIELYLLLLLAIDTREAIIDGFDNYLHTMLDGVYDDVDNLRNLILELDNEMSAKYPVINYTEEVEN